MKINFSWLDLPFWIWGRRYIAWTFLHPRRRNRYIDTEPKSVLSVLYCWRRYQRMHSFVNWHLWLAEPKWFEMGLSHSSRNKTLLYDKNEEEIKTKNNHQFQLVFFFCSFCMYSMEELWCKPVKNIGYISFREVLIR